MRRIISALKTLSALAALSLLAGCCTAAPDAAAVWSRVPSDYHERGYTGKSGFTADLPARWMALEDSPSQRLLLTRHGVMFDMVYIQRRQLPAALPYTALAINAHMRNYELAEAIINNMRSTSGVFDFKIEELAPYTIDGSEGFRVSGSYSMENGLRRKCLVFGAVHGAGDVRGRSQGQYYTEVGLYALDDYYFAAALGDFLALVGSLKVK